jgi:hypothetical protein
VPVFPMLVKLIRPGYLLHTLYRGKRLLVFRVKIDVWRNHICAILFYFVPAPTFE